MNVRTHSLDEIWHQSPLFAHFRGTDWMQEPCASCEHKQTDHGGCRCQAYMLTGDMHATDPVCSLSPHHSIIESAVASATTEATPLLFRNRHNSLAHTS